jgi:hypothetical protein
VYIPLIANVLKVYRVARSHADLVQRLRIPLEDATDSPGWVDLEAARVLTPFLFRQARDFSGSSTALDGSSDALNSAGVRSPNALCGRMLL